MTSSLRKKIIHLTAAFALVAAIGCDGRAASVNNTAVQNQVVQSQQPDGKKICFESYADLPAGWQNIFENTSHLQGYEGCTGEELYNRLSTKLKAAAMNLMAKAQATVLPDGSNVLDHIKEIRVLHQDRFFVTVDKDLSPQMDAGHGKNVFFRRTPATSSLHHAALPGFEKTGSYKTRDHHGNLDITLSHKDDSWIGEVDIDECRGLCHFFGEVVPHFLNSSYTEPLAVKKILDHQGINTHYTVAPKP